MPGMKNARGRRHALVVWLVGAGLAAATFIAFLPALGNGFVDYDDQVYVTGNPVVRQGVTAAGVDWAFRSTEQANWFPLTRLSHMLDVHLFGLAPAGHHLTSLLLHTAGAVTLFAALRSATGALWRSALVAALFALHPLRVESVVWVAERKDVLSGFFWMLTLAAHVRYARRPGPLRYALVAAGLTLGLMAKPVAVTLPAALLLLDFWPLGRWQPGSPPLVGATAPWRLLVEKIPLFALSAAAGAVTLWAQRAGGAINMAAVNTWPVRFGNATLSYVRYLGKAFLPLDLSPYYPFATHHPAPARVAAAALALAALTGAGLWLRRRWPAALVGWLWYLGTLVPMIGFVQVGNQAMADRYTYIPLIGICLLVVWAGAELPARLRNAAAGGALALLALFGALTAAQARHWRDEVSLFRQALRVDPDNVTAHVNLGRALTRRGDLVAANEAFLAALRLASRARGINLELGVNLVRLGRAEEALGRFATEVDLFPDSAEAWSRAATILVNTGRLAGAERFFREAVRLDPGMADAHRGLGLALLGQGRAPESLPHLDDAARISPRDPFTAYLLQEARKRLQADPTTHVPPP